MKYIDLTRKVYGSYGYTPADITVIRCTLEYLDKNPDQVPGRTITESEVERLFDMTRTATSDERLREIGLTIVADPKPTNTDRLEKLIRESGFEVLTLGRIADTRELAEWLNTDGVKAPGGSDE